jgi:hypothetical protein
MKTLKFGQGSPWRLSGRGNPRVKHARKLQSQKQWQIPHAAYFAPGRARNRRDSA